MRANLSRLPESGEARVRLPHRYAGFTGVYFALAFNMGTDTQTIMASPIGQPMATVSVRYQSPVLRLRRTGQILFNSFGTNGTLAIWSFIVVAQ